MILSEIISDVKKIDGYDLYWQYYANGRDPTLLDRNTFLTPREMERETHFIITEATTVIADGAVQTNPYNNSELWLKHVWIDPSHRRKGLARQILEAIYAYASANQQILIHSSYTSDGEKYLPDIIKALNLKYPTTVKR